MTKGWMLKKRPNSENILLFFSNFDKKYLFQKCIARSQMQVQHAREQWTNKPTKPTNRLQCHVSVANEVMIKTLKYLMLFFNY